MRPWRSFTVMHLYRGSCTCSDVQADRLATGNIARLVNDFPTLEVAADDPEHVPPRIFSFFSLPFEPLDSRRHPPCLHVGRIPRTRTSCSIFHAFHTSHTCILPCLLRKSSLWLKPIITLSLSVLLLFNRTTESLSP